MCAHATHPIGLGDDDDDSLRSGGVLFFFFFLYRTRRRPHGNAPRFSLICSAQHCSKNEKRTNERIRCGLLMVCPPCSCLFLLMFCLCGMTFFTKHVTTALFRLFDPLSNRSYLFYPASSSIFLSLLCLFLSSDLLRIPASTDGLCLVPFIRCRFVFNFSLFCLLRPRPTRHSIQLKDDVAGAVFSRALRLYFCRVVEDN